MKCLILFFVLFIQIIGFSQLKYVSTLDEAFQLAGKENKQVFIKYYSENCSHCKQLQQVLDIDSVSKFYSENFICYKIESENADPTDFKFLKKNRIFIENVPAGIFFDANRKFLHFGQPSQEAALVMKMGRTAIDPFERTSNLAVRYASGEKSMLVLKRYSKLAQIQKDSATINLMANEIFQLFPKDQLLSKNSITNTALYVKSINNGFFTFWMENYSKLDSVAPDIKLEDKEKIFKDVLSENINDFKNKWTLEKFKQVRRYIEITHLNENPYSFFWEEESNLLHKNNRDEEAFQIAQKMLELEQKKPHSAVYCVNFYSNLFSTPELLKKLKKQMDVLLPTLTDNDLTGKMYCYYLRIYKKLNDTKSFEKTKYQAKDFLTKNQLDMSLFEEVSK